MQHSVGGGQGEPALAPPVIAAAIAIAIAIAIATAPVAVAVAVARPPLEGQQRPATTHTYIHAYMHAYIPAANAAGDTCVSGRARAHTCVHPATYKM